MIHLPEEPAAKLLGKKKPHNYLIAYRICRDEKKFLSQRQSKTMQTFSSQITFSKRTAYQFKQIKQTKDTQICHNEKYF